MYNRILVPTDGSPEMARVVSHAVGLAETAGADISALYVVDTARLSTLPMEASFDTIAQQMTAEGRDATGRIAEAAGESVDVEEILQEGTPSREIVDAAGESDCDVVVMGTHGRGGIDRWLLGSVAERVVRRSPVPVLTVRVDDADALAG